MALLERINLRAKADKKYRVWYEYTVMVVVLSIKTEVLT
jgi:hypothetical protein